MKKIYPVIFTQTETDVLVEVPDLEILTQGTDMENAFEMARDAISVTIVSMEDNGEKIPKESELENIKAEKGTFFGKGKSFVSFVDADITEYRKKIDTKPVRRNVSIPSWLNYAVNEAHINVSKVLREALIEKLNV